MLPVTAGSIWKHLEECEMEKLLKRARFSGGCNLIYDTPPPAGAPPPCWLLLPPLFHVIVVVCSVRDTWSKHYRKDGRKYHNKEPIHPSIHPSMDRIHPYAGSMALTNPCTEMVHYFYSFEIEAVGHWLFQSFRPDAYRDSPRILLNWRRADGSGCELT